MAGRQELPLCHTIRSSQFLKAVSVYIQHVRLKFHAAYQKCHGLEVYAVRLFVACRLVYAIANICKILTVITLLAFLVQCVTKQPTQGLFAVCCAQAGESAFLRSWKL